MSSLNLTFEATPGSDIKDCCREGVRLANLLGIDVWFGFNGVRCVARPGDDAAEIEKAWWKTLKSDFTHKVASDRSRRRHG